MIRRSATTLFAACLLTGSGAAFGQISYFSDTINFWDANPTAGNSSPVNAAAALKKSGDKRGNDQGGFDWHRYLDPGNDEFFREGEYLPPAPFMEVTRNPSDDNLRLWFTYIEKKNALAARLNERMQEFAAKTAGRSGEAIPTYQAPVTQAAPSPYDTKRYRFRFYFDSQCPHCQHMFQTIEQLRALGFAVEGRQVDSAAGLRRSTFPVVPATREELGRQEIHSVPLLLIADDAVKAVYRLSGYQSIESVMGTLNSRRN